MAFHPYLAFSGNCRQAFTRYQQIFGGELALLTMADVPPDAEPLPGVDRDAVMHAALTMGDDLLAQFRKALESETPVTTDMKAVDSLS